MNEVGNLLVENKKISQIRLGIREKTLMSIGIFTLFLAGIMLFGSMITEEQIAITPLIHEDNNPIFMLKLKPLSVRYNKLENQIMLKYLEILVSLIYKIGRAHV